jgi:class 3 adenylate cyclase
MSELADATEAGWGSEAFVNLMYPPLADPAWAEGRRFLAKLQRHACGPATAFRFITLLNEYDVRDVLPTLQLPTLVLAPHAPSSSDPAAQAQSTANLIPGAICHDLPPGVVLLWHDSVADEVREFLGVDRPPPGLTRVLTTVMFTDIVGSTETAARLGDARWKEVLAAHDERARREIERHRGRYINTTGDGLLATFDGPARAVRCAQAIGEDVRSLGIEIRAGCHTGEIELVGEDIHGIGVHIGARVAAMAGPFEVLVSSTVKDLVAGSGLSFEYAGEHDLKGVPDRWHLYRVVEEQT